MNDDRIAAPLLHLKDNQMKKIFLYAGLLALIIGLVWVAQGLGYLNWPRNSFMIRQVQWSYNGGILAFIGLVLLWFARR